jgi:hypothetical protein
MYNDSTNIVLLPMRETYSNSSLFIIHHWMISRERVSFGLTMRNPGLSLGLLCALACACRGKWGEIFPIAVELTIDVRRQHENAKYDREPPRARTMSERMTIDRL